MSPCTITDCTVEIARESDYDRLIAHYMQPHIPYIAGTLEEDRTPTEIESRGWELLESGDADYEEVWKLYEDNPEVELLLDNINAKNAVITADHGNAFGEYTVHGHPEGMLLPCVKRLP